MTVDHCSPYKHINSCHLSCLFGAQLHRKEEFCAIVISSPQQKQLYLSLYTHVNICPFSRSSGLHCTSPRKLGIFVGLGFKLAITLPLLKVPGYMLQSECYQFEPQLTHFGISKTMSKLQSSPFCICCTVPFSKYVVWVFQYSAWQLCFGILLSWL